MFHDICPKFLVILLLDIYYLYSKSSYYAVVNSYYAIGGKSFSNATSLDECYTNLQDSMNTSLGKDFAFDYYCKFEDGNYYQYVAYNPNLFSSYFNINIDGLYLTYDECVKDVSKYASLDESVCVKVENKPREVRIKSFVENQRICFNNNNDVSYCDIIREPWSDINSSNAQAFLNYHKSKGFTCNDEMVSNGTDSDLVCYIELDEDNMKGFYYFYDGTIMAGTIIQDYFSVDYNDKYLSKELCEDHGYCVKYLDYYYPIIVSYGSEESCLDNINDSQTCILVTNDEDSYYGMGSDGSFIIEFPR